MGINVDKNDEIDYLKAFSDDSMNVVSEEDVNYPKAFSKQKESPLTEKIHPQSVGGLTINKNDEFFISIGKEGMHSFVMLGVMQQDGTPTLLARVGKGLDIDIRDLTFFKTIKILFNNLFSHNDATLYSEYLSSTKQREISYAAYAINYNQYLQFIKFISGFVNVDWKYSHQIYQPIPNTETDTTITLQKSHLDRTLNNIKIKMKNISLKNPTTCILEIPVAIQLSI